MSSEISLTFTLTKEHLLGAWRQHFRRKILRSRRMVFSMALLGISFMSIVLLKLCCVPILPVGMLTMVLAVVPGMAALNYFVAVPWSASRSKLRDKIFHVQISDSAISWRGQDIESDRNFTRFNDIREGERYFLLYLGAVHYFPLPKAAFDSQADMERFRQVLAGVQAKALAPVADEADGIKAARSAAGDGVVMKFRLTEAEQVAVLRRKFTRMVISSTPSLVIYGLFGVLAAIGIFMMLVAGMKDTYILLLTPALAAASGLGGWYWLEARRWARKLPHLGRDRVVVVNEEGVLIDDGLSKTHIGWPYVSGLRKSGELLVFDLGTDEYAALARRGFASTDDEKRFYDIVAAHIPNIGS